MIDVDVKLLFTPSTFSSTSSSSSSPTRTMPSSDASLPQWDASGYSAYQEVDDPNTLGESSISSPSRSLPRRGEDLLIPLMPADESRAPPAGCARDRGALIDEHYHLIPRDTGPVTMKSLTQSRCGELSRGGPVRQSCAFTGV